MVFMVRLHHPTSTTSLLSTVGVTSARLSGSPPPTSAAPLLTALARATVLRVLATLVPTLPLSSPSATTSLLVCIPYPFPTFDTKLLLFSITKLLVSLPLNLSLRLHSYHSQQETSSESLTKMLAHHLVIQRSTGTPSTRYTIICVERSAMFVFTFH
jgi:hypothetical protein